MSLALFASCWHRVAWRPARYRRPDRRPSIDQGPDPTKTRKSAPSHMHQSVRASCAMAQNPCAESIGSFVVQIATLMIVTQRHGGQPGPEPDDDERAAYHFEATDQWRQHGRRRQPDLREPPHAERRRKQELLHAL